MINIKYLTPMPSLIILGLFSTAMLLVSDIFALINYLAFAETAVGTPIRKVTLISSDYGCCRSHRDAVDDAGHEEAD